MKKRPFKGPFGFIYNGCRDPIFHQSKACNSWEGGGAVNDDDDDDDDDDDAAGVVDDDSGGGGAGVDAAALPLPFSLVTLHLRLRRVRQPLCGIHGHPGFHGTRYPVMVHTRTTCIATKRALDGQEWPAAR